MKTINLKRSFLDYSKVQNIISRVIRNKTFQLKKKLIEKEYLDVGCGPNVHDSFINLDYFWTPSIDICWDITKLPYPFKNNTFLGIYTEHCLEHIPFESFKKNVAEFYRMLKKGGVLRIVVPDGELYFDIYQQKKNGQFVKMPYEEGYLTPMLRINGLFRNHGHKVIYDFQTIEILLKEAGFKDIHQSNFMESQDTNLNIDSEHRKEESLYVEAVK